MIKADIVRMKYIEERLEYCSVRLRRLLDESKDIYRRMDSSLGMQDIKQEFDRLIGEEEQIVFLLGECMGGLGTAAAGYIVGEGRCLRSLEGTDQAGTSRGISYQNLPEWFQNL